MTLRLYDYDASANCYKVRLLLAQLGLEYEKVPVDIFAGETLTDEYARYNPAREVPVLETGDGMSLPESGAILLFLAEGTPFLPGDPFGRAQAVRWLLYEQAAIVPPIAGLRFRLATRRIDPSSSRVAGLRAAGDAVLTLLDGELSQHPFLTGDAYTIADIAVYGYVHVAGEAGYELDRYPDLQAWLARVADQPGYMNDLEPYPPNSMAGTSRSIYD